VSPIGDNPAFTYKINQQQTVYSSLNVNTSHNIYYGDTNYYINSVVTDINNNQITNLHYTYSSSNICVANLSMDGLVTIINAGNTNITTTVDHANYTGIVSSILNVYPLPISLFTTTPLTFTYGDKPTKLNISNSINTDLEYIYSSCNAQIININSEGIINVGNVGVTTIKCDVLNNNYTGSITLDMSVKQKTVLPELIIPNIIHSNTGTYYVNNIPDMMYNIDSSNMNISIIGNTYVGNRVGYSYIVLTPAYNSNYTFEPINRLVYCYMSYIEFVSYPTYMKAYLLNDINNRDFILDALSPTDLLEYFKLKYTDSMPKHISEILSTITTPIQIKIPLNGKVYITHPDRVVFIPSTINEQIKISISTNYLYMKRTTNDSVVILSSEMDTWSDDITSGSVINIGKRSYILLLGSTILLPINNLECLTETVDVLTPTGYINIKNLRIGDKVITSDGRYSNIIGLHKSSIYGTDNTYPYIVPAGSITNNYPPMDITLSNRHCILTPSGGWVLPPQISNAVCDKSNTIINYYHIQLENYKSDHLVINGGTIVESWNNGVDTTEYLKRLAG